MGDQLYPQDGEVAMVHYLCRSCGMSATMVVTPVGDLAWADHMATHDDELGHDSWTWSAAKLPFTPN